MHCKWRGSERPLFRRFSGGFWFSQELLFSRNSTGNPLNLIKCPIFTNTPCKSTCLNNAPSLHTVDTCFKGSRTSYEVKMLGNFWPTFGRKISHHVMDTHSGPVRDNPPYRAIPFQVDRRAGYNGTHLPCFHRVSRKYRWDTPFAGGVSHLHFACSPRGNAQKRGRGYHTQLAMLRHQKPHSAQQGGIAEIVSRILDAPVPFSKPMSWRLLDLSRKHNKKEVSWCQRSWWNLRLFGAGWWHDCVQNVCMRCLISFDNSLNWWSAPLKCLVLQCEMGVAQTPFSRPLFSALRYLCRRLVSTTGPPHKDERRRGMWEMVVVVLVVVVLILLFLCVFAILVLLLLLVLLLFLLICSFCLFY